ncbi:hypothetical protein Plhal304r1_c006g0024401 [Plasmopara halstedii]
MTLCLLKIAFNSFIQAFPLAYPNTLSFGTLNYTIHIVVRLGYFTDATDDIELTETWPMNDAMALSSLPRASIFSSRPNLGLLLLHYSYNRSILHNVT